MSKSQRARAAPARPRLARHKRRPRRREAGPCASSETGLPVSRAASAAGRRRTTGRRPMFPKGGASAALTKSKPSMRACLVAIRRPSPPVPMIDRAGRGGAGDALVIAPSPSRSADDAGSLLRPVRWRGGRNRRRRWRRPRLPGVALVDYRPSPPIGRDDERQGLDARGSRAGVPGGMAGGRR